MNQLEAHDLETRGTVHTKIYIDNRETHRCIGAGITTVIQQEVYIKLMSKISTVDDNFTGQLKLPYSLIRGGFTIGDWDQPVLKFTPNDLEYKS